MWEDWSRLRKTRGAEVSEWELREQREREEGRKAEAEELGAAGELGCRGAVTHAPLIASAEDKEEE